MCSLKYLYKVSMHECVKKTPEANMEIMKVSMFAE